MLAIVLASVFLGTLQEPSLATIRSIDGQPAIHVQTDDDLALLLATYPSTPVAIAKRMSHQPFYWYTPGLNCSADQGTYGVVSRDAGFVLIDDFGGPHNEESVRAARHRERTLAVHNLALLEHRQTPENCVSGSMPPEDWSRPG